MREAVQIQSGGGAPEGGEVGGSAGLTAAGRDPASGHG